MNRSRQHRRITTLVVLVVAAGCGGSDPSPTQPKTDPADTTPPTLTLSASTAAVTSDETVTLTATATDNVGVISVTFLDGTTMVGTDTSAPWSMDIDLTATANGSHTFTATARVAAGNTSASRGASVEVAILNVPYFDDFEDNWADSTQWTTYERGGPTAAETGGRVVLTIPASTSDETPAVGFGLRCDTPPIISRSGVPLPWWAHRTRAGPCVSAGKGQR